TRLVGDNLLEHHADGASKRELAGQQLIEDDPEGVDIAAAVDAEALAARLLRAHVSRRAQDLAFHGQPDVSAVASGEAEIHDVRELRWAGLINVLVCSAAAHHPPQHDVRGL